MAKFKCNECSATWDVTGSSTMRVRDGKVRHFDSEDKPTDVCSCGSTGTHVKTTTGLAGFVSTKGGGSSNFKRS